MKTFLKIAKSEEEGGSRETESESREKYRENNIADLSGESEQEGKIRKSPYGNSDKSSDFSRNMQSSGVGVSGFKNSADKIENFALSGGGLWSGSIRDKENYAGYGEDPKKNERNHTNDEFFVSGIHNGHIHKLSGSAENGSQGPYSSSSSAANPSQTQCVRIFGGEQGGNVRSPSTRAQEKVTHFAQDEIFNDTHAHSARNGMMLSQENKNAYSAQGELFFSGDERSRSAQQNFNIPVRSQQNKNTSSAQGDLFFQVRRDLEPLTRINFIYRRGHKKLKILAPLKVEYFYQKAHRIETQRFSLILYIYQRGHKRIPPNVYIVGRILLGVLGRRAHSNM